MPITSEPLIVITGLNSDVVLAIEIRGKEYLALDKRSLISLISDGKVS